jgi:hypothetical protein
LALTQKTSHPLDRSTPTPLFINILTLNDLHLISQSIKFKQKQKHRHEHWLGYLVQTLKQIDMIKTVFFWFIAAGTLMGCSKGDQLETGQQSNGAYSSNAVSAVPINEDATIPLQIYVYNPCSGEYVQINGTIRYKLRGMISNNKITYILHYNYSNVTGVGLSSGTKYIANGAFNYSNTDNFSQQLVYQQNSTFNYIALRGDASFKIINDWHLTVNANGVATFFFTTGGEVLSCK